MTHQKKIYSKLSYLSKLAWSIQIEHVKDFSRPLQNTLQRVLNFLGYPTRWLNSEFYPSKVIDIIGESWKLLNLLEKNFFRLQVKYNWKIQKQI